MKCDVILVRVTVLPDTTGREGNKKAACPGAVTANSFQKENRNVKQVQTCHHGINTNVMTSIIVLLFQYVCLRVEQVCVCQIRWHSQF